MSVNLEDFLSANALVCADILGRLGWMSNDDSMLAVRQCSKSMLRLADSFCTHVTMSSNVFLDSNGFLARFATLTHLTVHSTRNTRVEIDLSALAKVKCLTSIECARCNLGRYLDFSRCALVRHITLRCCASFDRLRVPACTEELIVSDCDGLDELDVTYATRLRLIYVPRCKALKHVDASGCARMRTFVANGCMSMTVLDVTGCTALDTILVDMCWSLKKLDASSSAILKTISARGCARLDAVHVHAIASLTRLDIPPCARIKNAGSRQNPCVVFNFPHMPT